MRRSKRLRDKLVVAKCEPTDEVVVKVENDAYMCEDLDEDEAYNDDCSPEKSVKRPRGMRFEDEPITIVCQWQNCGETYNFYDPYVSHATEHFQQMETETDTLNCGFLACKFQTTFRDIMGKHVAAHVHLERLKSIGRNAVERFNLPDCHNFVNEITFSLNYTCKWGDCDQNLPTIQTYLEHINTAHILTLPHHCLNSDLLTCRWHGCTSTFNTQRKVKKHMRMHTGEKLIACATCACSFSSRGRFIDHRNRQLPVELQSYQCSECQKLFATERLLRDHMRLHINHYKCTMCDMTCSRPAILAAHIRFRHMNERPFKCSLCSHATVTKRHLEQHLTTHCADNLMTCEFCKFSCRSMYGLERHVQKEHSEGALSMYACHCCDRLFSRGGHLSRHLLTRHNYNWPSGHSRFKYKQSSDGYFRLQTVRYESLEVTQEMMREKLPTIDTNEYDILIRRDESGRVPSFVLTVKACKTEADEEADELVIEDVDEFGKLRDRHVFDSLNSFQHEINKSQQ